MSGISRPKTAISSEKEALELSKNSPEIQKIINHILKAGLKIIIITSEKEIPPDYDDTVNHSTNRLKASDKNLKLFERTYGISGWGGINNYHYYLMKVNDNSKNND